MTTGRTAFVFARGGSKGLPGKNVRPLAGKPLIGWAIEQALAVPQISRVIVSTDSEQIAEVAQAHGATVPFRRPAELSSDTAPELLAWRHAITWVQQTEGHFSGPFLSIPATAPLRLPCDIEAVLAEYDRSGADVVLSVTSAHRNPWFNMVKSGATDSYVLVNDDGQGGRVTRRQDAPEVFDITTVAYAARPEFILAHGSMFDGRVAVARVPVERTIDIDTSLDFDIAEFLMQRRLAGQ